LAARSAQNRSRQAIQVLLVGGAEKVFQAAGNFWVFEFLQPG
jgi:hypothetical protein